nr:hypothetical protein MANES_13G060200 [Ipomoea batatas]
MFGYGHLEERGTISNSKLLVRLSRLFLGIHLQNKIGDNVLCITPGIAPSLRIGSLYLNRSPWHIAKSTPTACSRLLSDPHSSTSTTDSTPSSSAVKAALPSSYPTKDSIRAAHFSVVFEGSSTNDACLVSADKENKTISLKSIEIEEGKESRLVRFNGTGTEHINEGRHGVTEETAVPLGSLGESPDLPGRPDFGIRVVRLDEPESLSHNTRRAGGRRQWRRSGCFRIAIGIYIVGAGR